jgi:hypothetical protein
MLDTFARVFCLPMHVLNGSERENKSAMNAARMPCKSATNRSPLDGSNANGKQRRKGMRDQEAISRAIAGELQGNGNARARALLYVFGQRVRGDRPPRPP